MKEILIVGSITIPLVVLIYRIEAKLRQKRKFKPTSPDEMSMPTKDQDLGRPDEPSSGESEGREGEDEKSLIEMLPSLSHDYTRSMEDSAGVKLDYNLEGLETLDKLISEQWEPNELPALNLTLLAFGGYVGECIRKLHGGEWVEDEVNGPTLVLFGGEGEAMPKCELYPILRVRKRLLNVDEDSLAYYFKELNRIIEE